MPSLLTPPVTSHTWQQMNGEGLQKKEEEQKQKVLSNGAPLHLQARRAATYNPKGDLARTMPW